MFLELSKAGLHLSLSFMSWMRYLHNDFSPVLFVRRQVVVMEETENEELVQQAWVELPAVEGQTLLQVCEL